MGIYCSTVGKSSGRMESEFLPTDSWRCSYDMCKAIDKHMVMTDIHLVEKKGGKSGDFYYEESSDHNVQ